MCIFWNFVLTSGRNISLLKSIYIRASKRSCYALSENGIAYCSMTYWFGYIRVWSRIALSNFCWVSIVFAISTANTSWTVARIPINNIIFWKNVMKTFKSIYENSFNRLWCLAEISTKCKNALFGQFKDHNSGRKHAN